jgi:hypothetical protein
MKILLKWKIWRIESALKQLVRAQGFKAMVWSFGAYWIDPKHMDFVVGVSTEKNKLELKSNRNFVLAMAEVLERFNWPLEARAAVTFDIESQESVDRESDGNWWYHYK